MDDPNKPSSSVPTAVVTPTITETPATEPSSHDEPDVGRVLKPEAEALLKGHADSGTTPTDEIRILPADGTEPEMARVQLRVYRQRCSFLPHGMMFPVGLAGQAIAATAYPFIMFLPTKVAGSWFGANQRGLATTIGVMANPLGVLLSNLISPQLVKEPNHVLYLNIIVAILSTVICIVATLGVTRSEPKTPPTLSAAQEQMQFFEAMMIIGGVIGATASGIFVDRTRRYTETMKVSMILAVVFGLTFLQLSQIRHIPYFILLACFFFGVMGLAMYPVGLEMSAECTFPVTETTSTGLVVLCGQVQAVLFMAIMTTFAKPMIDTTDQACGDPLKAKNMSTSILIVSGFAAFMAFFLAVFFKPVYKRMNAEKGIVEVRTEGTKDIDFTNRTVIASKRPSTSMDNDQPASKRATPAKLGDMGGKWDSRDNGALLVFTPDGIEPRNGTIVKTKSGNVFPRDTNDWQLWSPLIKSKLLELQEEGFKIVIFTNQRGIESGKVVANEFKRKITNVIKALNVFISTGSLNYRKPYVGMWTTMERDFNEDVPVDRSESKYCGDAAGRLKSTATDHSCVDRLFASNLGVPFQTPENLFFGNSMEEPYIIKSFQPLQHFAIQRPKFEPEGTRFPYHDGTPEIVVLVGSPASGKSFLAKELASKHDYVIVNQDTLGTKRKCELAVLSALKRKKKRCYRQHK
ncbi:Transporter, major facilitator family protein [Aphelenchoides besseyi]|nr:Transporter, major facilitator family protein [Aphelenchoides besseyi]